MLMAVKKPSRMGPGNVGVECAKANVHIVVTVMDHAW
jgi:hypothetical protein